MKTDELVTLLAKSGETVEQDAAARRFTTAIGWGMCGAMLLMAVTLGVRSDLYQAALLPMFWVKLAFPALVAVIALYAAARVARPGMRLGRVPAALAVLMAAVWMVGAVVLYQAAPSERERLIFGDTWNTC
ncbi:MAG: NrsF family protein, partial [Noviherbaspirillum sp.]